MSLPSRHAPSWLVTFKPSTSTEERLLAEIEAYRRLVQDSYIGQVELNEVVRGYEAEVLFLRKRLMVAGSETGAPPPPPAELMLSVAAAAAADHMTLPPADGNAIAAESHNEEKEETPRSDTIVSDAVAALYSSVVTEKKD